jgi:hypothetical protein
MGQEVQIGNKFLRSIIKLNYIKIFVKMFEGWITAIGCFTIRLQLRFVHPFFL